MDFEEAREAALEFRDEREWAQFHNPKDLAVSISIEASELLECFQWSGSDTSADGHEQRLREELADVLIYGIYMADAIGADIPQIIDEKLRLNAAKYPVDRARGKSAKYTEL